MRSPVRRPPTQGQPVLRIVVHGASGAGKTTTARALARQLGREVVSPAEDDRGRTLFFDWMEYEGGRVDGDAIRTQLITVPGHDPRRRRLLLGVADAVIFVVDSTIEGLSEAAPLLAEVRSEIAASRRTVRLVVQVNKRDHPDAAPMDAVRRTLDLVEDDEVVETVASSGTGVRQAFVFAVREGLRARNRPSAPLVPAELMGILEHRPAPRRHGQGWIRRLLRG